MKQTPMLPEIRNKLERCAVGIVLTLSERAEHPTNARIYLREEAGGVPLKFSDGDFATVFRRGRELFDGGFGRFRDNRQHPFFPESATTSLMVVREFEEQVPRTVNKNNEIKRAYFNLLRKLCAVGDDGEYGETASIDLDCMQRLSFRIHYGEIVAERKLLDHPEVFKPLITANDWKGVEKALRNPAIEAGVLESVKNTWLAIGLPSISPQIVTDFYRETVIPLTVAVEVAHLRKRKLG
jgi:chorismate mutase